MKARTNQTELAQLVTEQPNPATIDLDTRSALEIARIINTEDAKVAVAVRRALPQIAQAIDWIAESFRAGGRLIYVGTGTSGRLGALDSSECPPTFNSRPRMVQFVIAGGPKALARAVEADEDSRSSGEKEIAKKRPGKKDVVVALAASGRTPFTISALAYARRKGARSVAITCNRDTPIEKAADLSIIAEVGPEVVSGSTRMKAGTAQKMILNMLTTGAFSRIGYVYGNLMVNLSLKNSKLAERGVRILQDAAGVSDAEARKALNRAGTVQVALLMLKAGISRIAAEQALHEADGDVRGAIVAALSA